MKTVEEKAVQILASNILGNIDNMLSFKDFNISHRASVTTLLSVSDEFDNSCFFTDEAVYNEYVHLLIEEPNSNYLNTFNHESKL